MLSGHLRTSSIAANGVMSLFKRRCFMKEFYGFRLKIKTPGLKHTRDLRNSWSLNALEHKKLSLVFFVVFHTPFRMKHKRRLQEYTTSHSLGPKDAFRPHKRSPESPNVNGVVKKQ